MAVVAILQQLALYQIYGAMMMMFVVTPSLESIEHKLNSKSIKFPKLHKVPTLEAITSISLRENGGKGLGTLELSHPREE
jgi:hypothetical protein